MQGKLMRFKSKGRVQIECGGATLRPAECLKALAAGQT